MTGETLQILPKTGVSTVADGIQQTTTGTSVLAQEHSSSDLTSARTELVMPQDMTRGLVSRMPRAADEVEQPEQILLQTERSKILWRIRDDITGLWMEIISSTTHRFCLMIKEHLIILKYWTRCHGSTRKLGKMEPSYLVILTRVLLPVVYR